MFTSWAGPAVLAQHMPAKTLIGPEVEHRYARSGAGRGQVRPILYLSRVSNVLAELLAGQELGQYISGLKIVLRYRAGAAEVPGWRSRAARSPASTLPAAELVLVLPRWRGRSRAAGAGGAPHQRELPHARAPGAPPPAPRAPGRPPRRAAMAPGPPGPGAPAPPPRPPPGTPSPTTAPSTGSGSGPGPRRGSPQSPLLVPFDDVGDGPDAGAGGCAAGRGGGDGSGGGWTVAHSAALYNVAGWGAPYFAINAAGHLCVRPRGGAGPGAVKCALAGAGGRDMPPVRGGSEVARRG